MKSKFLLKVFSLVCGMVVAVSFNAFAGATFAGVLGFAPEAGAVAGNVVALVAGQMAPAGAMRAGVLTEIFTGEMIKAFRTMPESLGWMQRIRSYNQYVNQDVIHFVAIGGDPNVLVNNTTYPLAITALTDADKPITLDKFSTEATPVTDDELHAISYDKMASVQERHRDALREKIAQRGIHAIAPNQDAKDIPVIKTTGTSDGTRKKITFADILSVKRKFDAMGVPAQDRILVLCSDHVNDLLETEQKFKEHYNINQTEGKICRMYGFDIYEYDGCPYYNMTTGKKLAWGAVPAATDAKASVAFYAGCMMKAYGSTKFYHSEAAKDPLYHRNLVNFEQYGICLPLSDTKCRAAIVSAPGA
jgi:hypothetical protein